MKKLAFILCLLLFCGEIVLADDIQLKENTQLVEVENAGALLLLQKQPIYEKQTQEKRRDHNYSDQWED